jgi:hypothetical protein
MYSVEQARAYLPVGGIHPRRVHADEDVARPWLWNWGVLVTEHLRGTVAVYSYSFHRTFRDTLLLWEHLESSFCHSNSAERMRGRIPGSGSALFGL